MTDEDFEHALQTIERASPFPEWAMPAAGILARDGYTVTCFDLLGEKSGGMLVTNIPPDHAWVVRRKRSSRGLVLFAVSHDGHRSEWTDCGWFEASEMVPPPPSRDQVRVAVQELADTVG